MSIPSRLTAPAARISAFTRHLFALPLAVTAALLPAAASAQYGQVFWQGFENYGTNHQSYYADKLYRDFANVGWHDGFNQGRAYLSNTRKSGNHSLKVTYPAYKAGSGLSGVQAQLKFPGNRTYDKLLMEYDFKVSSNFQWKWGGKLPGLASGTDASGGANAGNSTGWTARFMWRQNGKLVAYLYRINEPAGTGYGEDVDLRWPRSGDPVYLARNTWYRLKQEIRLNTNNQANGRIKVWLNGAKVLDKGGIKWRNHGNRKIDNLYFSTFPGGGNDSNWWPTVTQQAFFDNLHVFTWN